MRILHLSDTHLFGDGTLHHGIVDTTAALNRVLVRAAELVSVDAVVVTGDLSDDGSAESYRLLRNAIDPWAAERGAAVAYTMGNHDLRNGFEAVIGNRTGVIEAGEHRIVRLDSSVPGKGYGVIDRVQLDWLEITLADLNTVSGIGEVVVVLHHPPVPASTPLLAALELQAPAELLAICATAGVRTVLAGHYHHPLAITDADSDVTVLVAPAVTYTCDIAVPAGHERGIGGSGFAVVDLAAGQPARTTAVAVAGPHDGTVLFELGPQQIAAIASAVGPS